MDIKSTISIEVRNESVIYVTMNGFVYYIDDSTGDQIIDVFRPHPKFKPPTKNEVLLEIARVVLSDDCLRERVLSELDITDEAAFAALEEGGS